jgi:tetratricopeptide (TPR) repeat protein
MKLKRQWFRPGRRIEQIGRLGAHPFFTRMRGDARALPAAAAPQRGFLPRAAENAGALFSLTLSLVLVVALAGLVWAFVQELRRDTVVIEPIAVPRDLSEQGYSPLVVSERLYDEVRKIQTESTSTRARRRLDSANALADIQVAGSGVSMKSLVRYARQWFGVPESTVSGEITRDGGDLVLHMRERGGGPVVVTEVRGNAAALSEMLRDGAREIVRHADPYTLAAHLAGIETPNGQYPLTLAAIRFALSHPPADDDPWALNLWGNILNNQGNPDAASEKYQAALALRPGFGVALVNWAGILWAQGKRTEALAKAEEAQRSDPRNANYRVTLAEMQSGLGRFAEADANFAGAVAADPANGQAQASWAFSLLERGHYADAAVHARQAIAVAPDDSYAYMSLYWAYWVQDRPRDAIQVVFSTRSRDMRRQQISRMRAFTALHEGKPDVALALFDVELGFFPRDPIVWYGKGEALRALGRHADAVAAYDTALKFGPHFREADIGAARSLESMGRVADAGTRLAQAAADHPVQPRVVREWGRALERQGRGTEAQAKYREADALMAAANTAH